MSQEVRCACGRKVMQLSSEKAVAAGESVSVVCKRCNTTVAVIGKPLDKKLGTV